MSYQALARKWRPRNFNELVGQEHVRQALVNALSNEQLHHAYLFTGTRGVGKTSIARILAKCLNCETGITAQPCNQCQNCQQINEGRFLDLIEVDAASNTKVEDTRELLENVPYAPTQGRFKIYLIDEVHMLSGHSFNALLKTLEEPPAHVKFLLATTDPQKLPVTILSRCLQFHLKNLLPEIISSQLNKILTIEKITFEEPALQHIARAANGSMRDALSLLDQAIAYGNGKVNTDDVCAMLGYAGLALVEQLIQALANSAGKEIFEISAQLIELGADFQFILEEIASVFHHIALLQAVPDLTNLNPAYQHAKLYLTQFSKEEVQLNYQIALMGRRDLMLSPSPKIGFEMTLLRMLAFQPAKIAITTTTEAAVKVPTKKIAATIKAPEKPAEIIEQAKPSATTQNTHTDWAAIIPKLGLTGIAALVVNNTVLETLTDELIVLTLDPSQDSLLNSKIESRIQDSLNHYFGKSRKLTIQLAKSAVLSPARKQLHSQQEIQRAALEAIETDPHVQTILKEFNGQILRDTVRPIQLTTDEEK